MKIKHRALALILSAIMVLTFMPAMAFAGEENPTGPQYWSAACEDVVLAPGETSCDLSISVELDSEDAYAVEGLEDPTFSYRWTKWDEDAEEYIDCGTEKLLTGATVGEYKFYVTDSYGNEDYNYAYVNNPEVIGIDFTPVGESVREIWSDNPFRNGDKITLRYDGFDDEITYEYKAGKWLHNGKEIPAEIDAPYEEGTFDVYDEENIGSEFTYVVRYNCDNSLSDGPFEAICSSGIASISFSPAKISIWGPDIQETSPDGVNYNIWYRYKWAYPNSGYEYNWFAKGDSLTVKYVDGSVVTYTATMYDGGDGDYWPCFANGKDNIWVDLDSDNLRPGNNNGTVSYRGAKTPVAIFIDTPELKAQREKEANEAKARAAEAAKEAIRQGTLDNSLPKVKLNKPAAKKTSITVKWKKLTKKQLKKSKATYYEIWVSESSTYPAGATTKEMIVKKSKSKWTCKGLTKNKRYFVQIRAIKYVGGVKHVGPWKQKTIKTKKK